MPNTPTDWTLLLIRRIFLTQVVLIAVSTVLVGLAAFVDLGFFWFAFLAGVFGSSTALMKRVRGGGAIDAEQAVHSWATTLMPLLYGGIMAAVAYFLFMSGILSGSDGGGLLTTNLFPTFEPLAKDGESLRVKDWLSLRPAGLENAGKLMVWCFVAGYSESLVTGVLERLQQGAGGE